MDIDIIAFDKLDGSNIRVEWGPKSGFCKYGTRKRLLSSEEPPLGGAILIFERDWASDLESCFSKQRWNGKDMRITCFFEFFGSNSFAGQHDEEDDHKLVLLDAHVHKIGILAPRDFIKIFGHLEIPEILYYGKANKEFIESVRNSTLDGMTFEGVVCKGFERRKKKSKNIFFKIKSQAWFDKLKDFCNGDEQLFEDMK